MDWMHSLPGLSLTSVAPLHSVQLHRQCPMDGRACTMVVSIDQGSIPKRVQGASNLGKSPTLEEGILEQELLD